MGSSRIVRYALDPYVNFLRFISGIASIRLATIWLGLGETPKIALVAYVTIFAVAINALAGFLRIHARLRAAQSLGAEPDPASSSGWNCPRASTSRCKGCASRWRARSSRSSQPR